MICRIHVIFGTVNLPVRNNTDNEPAHDQFDIPCEEGWECKEFEMVVAGGVLGGSSQMHTAMGGTKQWRYRATFVQMLDEGVLADETIEHLLGSGEQPQITDAQVVDDNEGDKDDD